MSQKTIFSLFTLIALNICLSGVIFSQGTTTRVTGIVTDSSGAVVTGATVTLERNESGVKLTNQTSDNGRYTFDLVQAGVYSVTVEKQGFKKFLSKENAAYVNQPASINVVLEIGDVSATVTVAGATEQVQTSTSGNIGSTIEQKALESLPIFGQRGRNPLDLINFVPGASTDISNESGGGVHVHGSRDRAFNFTLDGIDINESSFGGSNFTPLRPNPDSLQEFQIVTSNFTAELGRSSGAQVTFVTRSGTNNFHGNAFEYYQTPDFNANEYANKINGRPRGQFVQHIFGGSLGGPLFNPGFGEGTKPGFLRNRAFFFVNLQMLRATETRLQTRTVLTATARTGIFRYRQGAANAPAGTATATVDAAGNPLFGPCAMPSSTNCINTYNIGTNAAAAGDIGLDPFTLGLLTGMPLPNSFSAGGDGLNTAAYVFGAPQSEKQYDFVSKFDFKINDNNSFYIRYAQGQQNTIGDAGNGGSQSFPGYPNKVDTFRDPKNLAVNYRWSPTATFTNELIFGFNNYAFSFNNPDPNADTNPPFIFNLATDPYSNGAPVNNARRIKTYQYVDNVTIDFSPHVLKAGINFRFGKQIDDRSGVAGAATTLDVLLSASGANGNPIGAGYNLTAQTPLIISADSTRLQSLINDMVGRYGRVRRAFVSNADGSAFAPAGSRWDFVAKYPEYNFYFQDSWKARSNLTVDLGVRYEATLQATSSNRPILRPTQPVVIGSPGSTSLSWTEAPLFKNDFNNFAPSVGFAWDPFKNGKTSIRANYRLSYDRFNTFVFASSIFQNAPGNTISVTNTTGGTRLLRNGLPVLSPLTTTTPTPSVARTPTAFSTNSITVIDPDLKFPAIHQWSVSFQRELTRSTVLEVNFIGNRGTHLFGGYDTNQVNINASDSRCPGQTFLTAFNQLRADVAAGTGTTSNVCLLNYLLNGTNANNTGTQSFRTNTTIAPTLVANTPTVQTGGGVAAAALAVSQLTTAGVQSIIARGFNPSFFQRFPQFSGNLFVLDSNDLSRYQGLEFIFTRRITNGFGFNASYTWSLSKDTRSFDPTQTTVGTGTGQSAGSTPYDLNNRLGNYAWSDFDRRHAVRGSYTYEIPVGRGRMLGRDMPRVLDQFIGGWQVAGLVNITSGRPFTVYANVNTLSNVVSATADCNGCTRNMGTLIQESGTNYWFSQAQRALFTTPAPGQLGNTGRNFFVGPSFFQTDISLSKKVKVTESVNFELKVDAKNFVNSISFTAPVGVSTNAAFGQIRDRVFSSTFARKVQIGLKLNF
ncbi:MAG: TonB-dependent receptor domain-containing protein [Pyrinomonadaceae bacterium]